MSQCQTCSWLQGLSDEQLGGALACLKIELSRRWPNTVYHFSPAEMNDPDFIARKLAEVQAALPESIRGKTQ